MEPSNREEPARFTRDSVKSRTLESPRTAQGVTASGQKAMDTFREKYKKRFNIDVNLYAPYVYDAVMVMADAMKKANSAEPAKYLPVLAKTSYNGVTGKIVFDARGDIKDGALTLYTYKGGERKQIAVVK